MLTIYVQAAEERMIRKPPPRSDVYEREAEVENRLKHFYPIEL